MKITTVTLEEYRWPRAKPITNGKHTYSHVDYAIVRISTDEGLEGIGLGKGGIVERAIVESLTPLLIGQNPLNVERLWSAMWVPKLVGRRGQSTRAISAIDIGLWDLRGKAAGMPLHTLLGGYRDRVPTYVAGGYYEEGKGLRELAGEMEQYVALGARAVKMKVGGVAMAEDVERVRAVREAIGPGTKLMVDANCAYRHYEAIQLARRIEPFDIFWFEEPVAPDDYDGHRKVAVSTVIPIATGENEYTRYGFRDLIRADAASILNADAKICGGITEFMKVAALAQAHDLDISPHGSQDVHVHLVAAIPNGLILEFYGPSFDPMWGQIYEETMALNEDGTVTVPSAPGLGLTPNWKHLAPFRIA
ncbi:mandelate racemase/muconate lactonizing enzyme family protein [Bosea caraganae]|uniref:Mandelate racemase/muconate lactonizing enzyme family protein n=1 Tax=Bosea caraganae TaxID=2763117 RepID=A0A370L0I1_9HYPH|nr:mandelate racemase/muconate lactonizing enzyme family protein [Bosea caraganae]RDJ20362.1 mandelate racemase/muconate lactonizing enzyme family protein [Bosea caraganae]RDJ26557.1 mandelate racemase/muconate lactonizing enzyme family protein [Bosea caraganae]